MCSISLTSTRVLTSSVARLTRPTPFPGHSTLLTRLRALSGLHPQTASFIHI